MAGFSRRRPVWQPSRLSRLLGSLRGFRKHIKFTHIMLAFVVFPLFFYLYCEVMHEAVIIDPFTVPKRFDESGLTPDVISNRIGDAVRQIEIVTRTRMKKDNLISLHDAGSQPDVEIPGTKIGWKTAIDVTRMLFGVYPKRVSGDIVVATNPERS